MGLTHAWIREKATKIWHHTRISAVDAVGATIITRCDLKDLAWDRSAPMPGAGAQICRACVIAEEFDHGEKVEA